MIARGSQQISGLFLGGWRLPQKPCDGVRMCSFGDLGKLERIFGGAWCIDILRCWNNMAVEDLKL